MPEPSAVPRVAIVLTISTSLRSPRAQIEHVHEVALGAIGALAIGLVDDEHVGDLEQARLDRLDVIAEARAP